MAEHVGNKTRPVSGDARFPISIQSKKQIQKLDGKSVNWVQIPRVPPPLLHYLPTTAVAAPVPSAGGRPGLHYQKIMKNIREKILNF